MARFVLDTHTCVYYLSAPKRLGSKAAQALQKIETGHDEAWIPAAVVAELALLHELRRIKVSMADLKNIFEETSTLNFSPLDLEQLEIFSLLSSVRDPFDRFVISAARALEAKLITKDALIQESGLVQVVW